MLRHTNYQDHLVNEAIRYALHLYHVQKHELAHSVKYLKAWLDQRIASPTLEADVWLSENGNSSGHSPALVEDLTSVERKILLVALKYMRDSQDRSMHALHA
jgi:hypothetical protein